MNQLLLQGYTQKTAFPGEQFLKDQWKKWDYASAYNVTPDPASVRWPATQGTRQLENAKRDRKQYGAGGWAQTPADPGLLEAPFVSAGQNIGQQIRGGVNDAADAAANVLPDAMKKMDWAGMAGKAAPWLLGGGGLLALFAYMMSQGKQQAPAAYPAMMGYQQQFPPQYDERAYR